MTDEYPELNMPTQPGDIGQNASLPPADQSAQIQARNEAEHQQEMAKVATEQLIQAVKEQAPEQAAPALPEPEHPDYSPGSTMHDLGFRTFEDARIAHEKGLEQGIYSGSKVAADSVIIKDKDASGNDQYYRYPTTGQVSGATGRLTSDPTYQQWLAEKMAGNFTQKEVDKMSRDLTNGRITDEDYNKWYNDKIKAGIEAGQSKDYLVPAGDKWLTLNQAQKLQALKGLEQFSYAQKLGVLPEDSVYREGEGGIWSYVTKAEASQEAWDKAKVSRFEEDLKTQPAELQKAYKEGGAEGYNKAVTTYQASIDKQLSQFDAENISLGDKYMTRSDWDKLDSKYKDIALSGGFGAMEASIKQDEATQAAALDSLKFAQNKDGTYDFDKLASYARTHQDAQQTLKDAGFVELDKLNKEIKDYNNAPVGVDTFRERYFQDKGWGQPPSTMHLGSVSDKVQSQMIEANKAFDKQYGFGARVASSFSPVLATVFPPARALQPDVTLKDISGFEWGIGVAQIALFAIPAVGGIVGKVAGSTAGRLTGAGIGAAAGGVFTYDTVKNWSVMTPTERGIAVAMDTLILGGAAGSALRTIPKVNAAVETAKGKASASISKVIKGEGGGSFEIKAKEVQATIKEAQKALSDGDIDALRRAGEKLQAQGNDIPKEQGGEIISAKGKEISDKAAEIVKIAEKRLTVKQMSDLADRLGNNADFIESPSQKVIAEYQKIESDMANTLKKYESNKSALNTIETELEQRPKGENNPKSNFTKAEIEAEKVRLTQQISRDNAQLYELRNKGGELRDQQALSEQISQTQKELAELEKQTEFYYQGELDLEQLRDYYKGNTKTLLKRLDQLNKEMDDLTGSDEATGLWGTKYAGKEPQPREPLERGQSPEKGRGGTTTIEKVDKRVEVKPKTEIKEKIKQVEPDIDKLKKAKEKIEQEKKTREETRPAEKEKAKTTTRTRTTTEEPFTITQPKTGSYVGLVWENGRVFAKEIQPEELQKGYISTWSKTGSQSQTGGQSEIERRYQELLSTMTKAAALKKLAEEYPDSKSYPVVFSQPAIKTQAQAKTSQAQQIRTLVETKQETKTQQQTKIAPKTATESPKPQPVPKPQPKPKPEVKIDTKTKQKQRLKPPGIGAPEQKEWTPEEVKSAIAWTDGFAVHAIKSPHRRTIDEKSFNVNHLPPGLIVMKNYAGKGSQQRSAKVTGKFPSRLTVDVGNQDVIITNRHGKVQLRHMRDTRGTTSQTTINKGHSISQKRGRIYHTRAAGGTIIGRRPMRGY
jgi:hypothetical protein